MIECNDKMEVEDLIKENVQEEAYPIVFIWLIKTRLAFETIMEHKTKIKSKPEQE